MTSTIEPKVVVLTFGLRSLEILVFSLSQHHIPTVPFSSLEEAYLGELNRQGIAVERYPLILASLYGLKYIQGEVSIPEGISFAQLLREQDGPNKETPIFLFYNSDLTHDLIAIVSGVDKINLDIPTDVPENTTLLFNLNSPEEWKELHERTLYTFRYSSRKMRQ